MFRHSALSLTGGLLAAMLCGVCMMSAAGASERRPVAGRTLVFSRTQAKYDLGGNYMRRWTDRPLFQDTSLRNRVAGQFTTPESWSRIVETGKRYGLDGFAFLAETSGRAQLFELTDRVGPAGFSLLPEFVATADLEAKYSLLGSALACKSCIRINGRIPITAYRSDALPLNEWRDLLKALRAKFGEAFIFLPDISVPAGQSWDKWAEAYRENGALPTADLEQIRAGLRQWLEVFDGLYFAAAAALKIDRRFDEAFYREVLIPAYLAVLAEPRFEGKYLGLSAMIGHENCTRVGYTLSHDGTKTLRRSFEAAMAARPDLIVLPEWDEQNENTSLRPTVYNSFSTERILRYYLQRLHRQPPQPEPGDDLGVPNLVVSYRKILSLGEVLEVELLNVPDGSRAEPYAATLVLKDIDGRTVAAFPEVSFAPAELADHTLRIASERLAAYPVVRPSLEIRSTDGKRVFEDGLHHIQLRATWNWDYKWVKLPLRDLCVLQQAGFGWDAAAAAGVQGAWQPAPSSGQPVLSVRGLIECGEDLAAVEVLDDDDVVYAVDPSGSGLRDRSGEVVLGIELRSFDRIKSSGTITVRGSNCSWADNEASLARHARYEGNRLSLADNVDWQLRQHFVSLPRMTAARAVLDCDFDWLKTSIPVDEILRGQIYSETRGRGTTLTVSLCERQADHPLHLNRRRVEFTAAVRPDTPASVYHLRAVTTAGRIYCSRPWLPPGGGSAAMVPLEVWSDSRQEPATVSVEPRRIPDIRYAFDPSRGTALWTDAGRAFWAHMGGFTDSVTGRGGDGGLDGSPFVRGTTYPKAAKEMAPRWVREDGANCLAFDGLGNFIAMPQGVLPRRGSFRLMFHIKPASSQPQLLFSHTGNYIGSLSVYLKDGKLGGSFVGERQEKFNFPPVLAVPAGQWSRVEVVYDLDTVRLCVNGAEGQPLPCRGPGLYDTPSVFGGFGDPAENTSSTPLGWFKGHLRSLRVTHNSAPAKP